MRIRTGYSFKFAFGHLNEVADRLKEIGWSRQPISDRCSTYSFSSWSKLVKDPIYGVEIAVAPVMGEPKPRLDYWAFFAIDEITSIHKLVEHATSNAQREPYMLYRDAINAKGVIKIAGGRSTLFEHLPKNAAKVKNFYIALSPSMPIGLYRQARKAGIKFIASSDNTYTNEIDLEIYRMALWRHAGTQTYAQHILSDAEWKEAVSFADKKDIAAALRNRDAAFKICRARLVKATLFKPERKQTLRAMCITGAKRKGCDLNDPVYSARLDRELKMIADKKFEDYFYIIADIIGWAKKRMIVGPARGSSCGSLVCYLLDITTVDPIPYNLIFERFIDITRADLPDIDIDFSDARRHLVFEYVEKKYGREHIARLGTIGTFLPRSALKACGAALHIPIWKVERVLDSVIVRSSGDSRALQQLEDTLNDREAGRELVKEYPQIVKAARLEGHPQNASQHAAGIVITAEPIDQIVAIDRRTNAAMCDKFDAEHINLLKIDALGLTQLSTFERTLELTNQDYHGFLERIPLNDPAAFAVLNRKAYAGIFQFNGMALQSIAKQIDIDKLEDIVAITALARPGPMSSGGTRHWVSRRKGEERIEYLHPLFEPYLCDTLGVVTYQEQVLQIGRNVGDLSWEDVTALRKAMSKSLGKEFFDQYGNRWKSNAEKKGIPAQVCEKFWDDLCSYGSWAFNRAHAVAYGLVSYYCCWFKAHYPLEFAAATLDAESNPALQINLLRELHFEGIHYQPVDPKHSDLRWSIKQNGKSKLLVGPLTMVHGIGPATANEIIEARANGKPMNDRIAKKLNSASTAIDSIFPVSDAVKRLWPDLSKAKILTEPTPIVQVQCGSTKGDVVILAVCTKIAPKDDNEAVNVAKRGYKVSGPSQALNLFMKDDTDEIFCKVHRRDYKRLAIDIIENGIVGTSLYAIKGSCPPDFRMLWVKAVKYLGELDQFSFEPERGGATRTRKEEDKNGKELNDNTGIV